MDKHDVCLQVQVLGMRLIDFIMQGKVSGRQRHRKPLEPIVQCFGDMVKFRWTTDDFPPHLESQLLHQRDHPSEDLCDTTPSAGGVDMHDPFVPEPPGELAQALDLLMANHLFIPVEPLHTVPF